MHVITASLPLDDMMTIFVISAPILIDLVDLGTIAHEEALKSAR
jgi:hypothetical protein